MPQTQPINDFVVAGLGIATVFAALICIIFICNIMGAIFKKLGGTKNEEKHGAAPAIEKSTAKCSVPAEEYVTASIKNRGEVIAAISAAIAEDTGSDISRIRILSVKERAGAIQNRGELCAAIGAVICAETGADKVRVHSIRKV